MSWASSALFFEQLAATLTAGLPIDSAIALAGSASGDRHRRQAPGWSRACAHGTALSDAMAASGEPALDVALVRAGERSGHLPGQLRHLAGIYQHRIALRSLVLSKLWYPAMLLHAALVVPALPLVVQGASPWRILAGPAVLWTALAVGAIGFLSLWRSGAAARLALRWPCAVVTDPATTANTAQVLGAGIAAGMIFPDALELAAPASGNRVLAQRLRQAAHDLRYNRHDNLSTALAAAGWDGVWLQLIRTGEATGGLDQACSRIAAGAGEILRFRAEWAARILTGTIYGLTVAYVVWTIVSMYLQHYINPMRELLPVD